MISGRCCTTYSCVSNPNYTECYGALDSCLSRSKNPSTLEVERNTKDQVVLLRRKVRSRGRSMKRARIRAGILVWCCRLQFPHHPDANSDPEHFFSGVACHSTACPPLYHSLPFSTCRCQLAQSDKSSPHGWACSVSLGWKTQQIAKIHTCHSQNSHQFCYVFS